jgi:hypothetical protein
VKLSLKITDALVTAFLVTQQVLNQCECEGSVTARVIGLFFWKIADHAAKKAA